MTKHPIVIFVALAAIALLSSCRKDRPAKSSETPIEVGTTGGVYITNEGNFQYGNAKVSYYNIATSTVVEDLYEPANDASLGDVCQSMYLFNGKAYLVVNNSNKVEVVNPLTFQSIATITGFISPRYFLPVSNNKAYVTDIYSKKISVVNLSTNTITGTIACAGATEELILSYGKAFVTNTSRSYIYVINTATDVLEDSIHVSYGSNSIKEDKNGKLWVMCGGNTSTQAALHKIDPITLAVENSFQFSSSSDSPWRLRMNGTNDTLYYLNNGVYQMDINASNLPTTAFISSDGRNFYGLGIHPTENVVYVADAIDYVQRGMIYRYQPNGTLVNTFLAGIIPNDFCFN